MSNNIAWEIKQRWVQWCAGLETKNDAHGPEGNGPEQHHEEARGVVGSQELHVLIFLTCRFLEWLDCFIGFFYYEREKIERAAQKRFCFRTLRDVPKRRKTEREVSAGFGLKFPVLPNLPFLAKSSTAILLTLLKLRSVARVQNVCCPK